MSPIQDPPVPRIRARYGDAGHTAATATRFTRDARVNRSESREDERRTIAAATGGDEDALRYLYLRFKDNVYGYLCSIVRDEHEAEDLTQHVFAKVLPGLGAYQARDDVPFSAWLLRVARNVALDHLRQRRATPQEELPDVGVAAVERHIAGLSLRDALDELPEDQRRVVVMRHVVGLTPVEIAARLGRTESSIHALHHRGRQRLRVELREAGSAPVVLVPAAA
ncbi:MAG: sigma-70 family RNA polymerase sigma factor [Solirubrobacteraceae bacterium]|nr:sigma-70 family RNA polymerase sigma factor [Solirubrobacteraceae bacterium]